MIVLYFILINFIFIVGFNVFIHMKCNPERPGYNPDYLDENYKKILFLIIVPVICDIFFILYRFRYRENYLDFEVFVSFFLFISYLLFFVIMIFNYVLSDRQKLALYITKKLGVRIINGCISNLSRGGDFRFFVLELRIYKKIEALYREYSLKPQFSAICFVLVPWILFLIIFVFETWRGQGFWLVLYCMAIRVTLFRLRNVIDYCSYRALKFHIEENLMNNMKRDDYITISRSREVILFSQDLESLQSEFFIGFSYLSYNEGLCRWCGFKSVITFTRLYAYTEIIGKFFYKNLKSFVQDLNLLFFTFSLIGFYLIKFHLSYLIIDLLWIFVCVVSLLVLNFIYYKNKPKPLLAYFIDKQKKLFDLIDFYCHQLHVGCNYNKDHLIQVPLNESMSLSNNFLDGIPPWFSFGISRRLVKIKIFFRKFWKVLVTLP